MRKLIFNLILTLIIGVGSVAPVYAADSCRAIFGGSTLPLEARMAQQLLERPVPAPQLHALQLRWEKLDTQLHGNAWESFYEAQQVTAAAKKNFELIQEKRMSPSTTISGKNVYDPRGDQAAINWRAADLQVHEWVKADVPLSIERFFELNKIIGEKLYFNGNKAGRRRTGPVGVPYEERGISKFQNALSPHNIDPMLEEFENWYRTNEHTLHPIQLAAQAYQRLNTIHPFPDGNGRTTRLIMDWILRKRGYPPGVFQTMESTYVVIFPNDQLGRNPAPGFIEEVVTSGLEWVATKLPH